MDTSRSVLPRNVPRKRVTIFTDARGNVDNVWGSEYLGGLAILSEETIEFFMAPVSEVCAKYLDSKSAQRINQCEAAAAFIALSTWAKQMVGCWVTVYIDNAAAEGSISKGYSKSLFLANIAAACWSLAEQFGFGLWVERVQSSLNPADALSRGDSSNIKALGGKQVQARWAPVDQWGW